jgi:hypothetical protein
MLTTEYSSVHDCNMDVDARRDFQDHLPEIRLKPESTLY